MPRRSTHTPTATRGAPRRPRDRNVPHALRFIGTTAALILTLTLLVLPQHAHAQSTAAGKGIAVVARIDGAIGPATTELVRQAFADARARDAAVIVLEMDTPGGLSSSMRDIIRHILASPVPVLAYVAPSGARAASAGTYILYASHLAAMAPGTNLGAATPVQLGGGLPGTAEKNDKDTGQSAETAKAMNDAAAYIRSLALLRGRNVEWAEEAVRKAASLSAQEALKAGVIDLVATNLDDLLAQADGRMVNLNGRQVTLKTRDLHPVVLTPSWTTQLLAIITNPNIAYLLLLIGFYGIIFEFWSPGGVAPGVVGAIALLVGLFALNLLPINYAGMGLLLLGMALMVAEAFAPSFGILGIGGIVAFALGSLFLFDEAPGFTLSLPVVLTASGVSLAFLTFVLAVAIRAHRLHAVSGAEGLIGEPGQVLSWSGSSGDVHVHGERWHARAAGPSTASFATGTPVRVTGRDRLTLLVEPEQTPQA